MNRRRALIQVSRCITGGHCHDIAWRDVIALANERFITAELLTTLTPEARKKLPSVATEFLIEAEKRTRRRNRELVATLQGVAGLLNEVGVEPLLMKGAATWVKANAVDLDPPRPRLTSDLDLMLTAATLARGVERLSAAGYHVMEDNRGADHAVVVMGRTGDVGALDLHLAPPGWRGRLDASQIWPASRRVRCGDAIVRTLPPHLLIFILMTHDQVHELRFWRGGFDLRHLLDIRALASNSEPVDWRELASLARRAGLEHALAAQLWAARDIAGASVPDSAITTSWARWHYARQRLQFIYPPLNRWVRGLGWNTALKGWLRPPRRRGVSTHP